MKTEIHLVGGEIAAFGDGASVKMTDLGVEVVERDGEEQVKVLFPWSRIERVQQRGLGADSVYTF